MDGVDREVSKRVLSNPELVTHLPAALQFLATSTTIEADQSEVRFSIELVIMVGGGIISGVTVCSAVIRTITTNSYAIQFTPTGSLCSKRLCWKFMSTKTALIKI